MKTSILSILALYSLTTQAATLPLRDAAQFDDVSPEAIRAYLTSRSTDVTKRDVGGVGDLSTTSIQEKLIKFFVKIYICTGEYWTGTCGYKVQPLNACIHLDAPWV
jgi:hypothetical protein